MKLLIALLLLAGHLTPSTGFAATVDTVSVYSEAMNRSLRCVVIQPKGAKKRAAPTLYLLHGYTGAYDNWIRKMPELASLSDQYQMFIICPDGASAGWYLDSPVDSSMRFETYIALEVPAYIDAHYNTIKKRSARAISGLSMGGHGALYLGFRHPDIFGACGSMSGALDIEALGSRYELAKRLGDTLINKTYYRESSIFHLVEQKLTEPVSVIFDCGVSDQFIEMNRKLHTKMLALKIPHDYTERPGGHGWSYWTGSLPYHLLFFSTYFSQKEPVKKQTK